MTRTPFHFAQVIAFCAPLALVTSCGKGTESVQSTTINIFPPNIGQATTAGFPGTNSQSYSISLISPTGYPQIGATVRIMSQYTVYEGQHSFADLASLTPVALPYYNTTDTNGTLYITVLYDWGTAIKGDFTAFEAWSGTAYQNSSITFTCSDPNATGTAPDCPQ